MVGITGLIFKLLTKLWQKFSLWIFIASHHHSCSQETLALLFSFPQMGLDWRFMGRLPGQRSALYECNSLILLLADLYKPRPFLHKWETTGYKIVKKNNIVKLFVKSSTMYECIWNMMGKQLSINHSKQFLKIKC